MTTAEVTAVTVVTAVRVATIVTLVRETRVVTIVTEVTAVTAVRVVTAMPEDIEIVTPARGGTRKATEVKNTKREPTTMTTREPADDRV